MSTGTVAVNAAILGDRPTGLGLYALHVVETLAGLGERLIVYTSRPDLFAAMPVEVRPAPAAARPERGAAGHLVRLVWIQVGLRARMSRARPRVLLNLMPEGLLRPPVPQVTTVHDLLPLRYPEEYPRQQYYFRYYVPAVLRASRAVVVSSESTRRDILHFYPRVAPATLHVVHCGLDARRFSPGAPSASPDGVPYALCVGNVMPHKNLLRLADAFAQVARRTSARLVIRGWGKPVHVRALRDRLAALGLGAQVDWQPYAGEDELPALYRGARMLVLPSLYEGFGLTALEAMACGTPVVAAGTSSLPEVVGDAALLVDPLDVGAIGGAMERVFADDALAKDLRERGLARAAAFSWDRTGRAVQRLLHEVAERG